MSTIVKDFSKFFKKNEQIVIGFRDGFSHGYLKGFDEQGFYVSQLNCPKTLFYSWQHFEVVAHAGSKLNRVKEVPPEAVQILILPSFVPLLDRVNSNNISRFKNKFYEINSNNTVLHEFEKDRANYKRIKPDKELDDVASNIFEKEKLISSVFGIVPVATELFKDFQLDSVSTINKLFLTDDIYIRSVKGEKITDVINFEGKGYSASLFFERANTSYTLELYSEHASKQCNNTNKLYLPKEVHNEKELEEALKHWTPNITTRTYSGDPWEFDAELVDFKVWESSEGYIFGNRNAEVFC
jgi:hypothetical protein